MKPEMAVRKLVHSLCYRYRLHRKGLPGKPDIAFPTRRKVIFVHGCFWHQHYCSRGARRSTGSPISMLHPAAVKAFGHAAAQGSGCSFKKTRRMER